MRADPNRPARILRDTGRRSTPIVIAGPARARPASRLAVRAEAHPARTRHPGRRTRRSSTAPQGTAAVVGTPTDDGRHQALHHCPERPTGLTDRPRADPGS